MGRDRLLKQLLRERFVITMTDGAAFDGILDRVDESTLELVDAGAIGENETVKVDGRIYLPRARVAYLQRPAG